MKSQLKLHSNNFNLAKRWTDSEFYNECAETCGQILDLQMMPKIMLHWKSNQMQTIYSWYHGVQ